MPARSQIRKAESLLKASESVVPVAVQRVERFLAQTGIWFRFTRNATAMSCRDAANRRERLGHIGIPIWDELKSIAFSISGELVFVHCRGDELLNLDAVALALSVDSKSLQAAEPARLEQLGLGYGLVNPFNSWLDEDPVVNLRHVFDEGLLRRLGTPGTMMTNAGDRTWAVEFYVDELVRALPNASVASVRAELMEEVRPPWTLAPPPIGIVTGNAPESGLKLLQTTIDTVRVRLGKMNLGDISLPPILLASVPEMGLSMELSERAEAVLEAASRAVDQLCSQGCRLIAVACNTTQYFENQLEEICRRYDAEFLVMPQVVASWLSANNVTAVGLVGIKYVSDLGEWSAYRPALDNLRVDTPSPHGMRRIEEIAYQVKAQGATPHALGRLTNILRDVIDQEFGSEYVILALTELSMLVDLPGQPKAKHASNLLDPLRLYGEALAHRYLGLPFPLDIAS